VVGLKYFVSGMWFEIVKNLEAHISYGRCLDDVTGFKHRLLIVAHNRRASEGTNDMGNCMVSDILYFFVA
jgi:hypothetical protein